jgi:alkanesulfonate monooxygenase SsuD/methylene tetrahydromethanopterin reductase-like flavin-dependent oxidoreductase (luciferase family)
MAGASSTGALAPSDCFAVPAPSPGRREAATVDHISRGRLVFGVGRSGFPRAYEAYGISYGESTERFAEVLDVVKRAWTQETFSFIVENTLHIREVIDDVRVKGHS